MERNAPEAGVAAVRYIPDSQQTTRIGKPAGTACNVPEIIIKKKYF